MTTNIWTEKRSFLEDKIKIELINSFSLKTFCAGNSIIILLFTHRNDNNEILIKFTNGIDLNVNINLNKKTNSEIDGFSTIKSHSFNIEKQDEILQIVQTYKKIIELKELFKNNRTVGSLNC